MNAAPSLFEASETLRDWVREEVDEWSDQCPDGAVRVLCLSLVNAAFGQVDWEHVAGAFQE